MFCQGTHDKNINTKNNKFINHASPKYFLLVSMSPPRYLLRISSSGPPFFNN